MKHSFQLKTPVALFIFNRPELTGQVFQTIAAQRPSKILVIADGARPGREGEVDRCIKTRELIHKIDWDCEVLTNFSETNLGCRDRITSGLDWVFDHVEEAIILEDDCVPDPTFYRFCEELLEKYRDDERIVQICGANLQDGNKRGDESYYFSRFNYIWGWATWRRAWKNHDVDMKIWPEIRQSGLLSGMGDPRYVHYWNERFDQVFRREIDTWDYQWMFTSWIHNGLAIVPNVNLIKNIGFGPEATHTLDPSSKWSKNAAAEIEFPLRHPKYFVRNCFADDYDMNTRNPIAIPPSLGARILGKIASLIRLIR